MSDFLSLRYHPESAPRTVVGVNVALERPEPGKLWLRYMITAPLDGIVVPGPREPLRADFLWRSTCFELFLRRPGADDYIELNFSPSGEWAAYRFATWRHGRSLIELRVPPRIELSAASDLLDAEVTFELPVAPDSKVSLTTIVEETDGAMSYWALALPPEGPPDFHHPACFVLELPPP